jgi:hypothetical protein
MCLLIADNNAADAADAAGYWQRSNHLLESYPCHLHYNVFVVVLLLALMV